MCGLAGFSGDFSEAALHEAERSIAHRGPDNSGVYSDAEQRVGLVHRRLSIIDLSEAGAQPMSSPDGSLVLVFNGEIYNYRELREPLVAQGVRFRGHSDTEVLLHLYAREGQQMLERLNGIFALALWDLRDRSLLLVRDALGVKPLYYAESARGVAFASEIKALLRIAPELRELDPVALSRYLTFLWCPGRRTPLEHVKKVLPGEALSVRDGRVERRWTWYRHPFLRGDREPVESRDAISGTTEHVRRAVHRQLVSDVPVGAFLSGGLDSSAVVAFAREQAPDIQCFTIDVPNNEGEGFAEDLPYARRVAAHLGVALHVITVEADSMVSDLEDMIWHLDEPLADPAPLNVLYISQLARRHGMKVLLSGAGGDDVFSGYRRHAAIAFDALWDVVPRPLRVGLHTASTRLDRRRPTARRLEKLLSGARYAGPARLTNYFRWLVPEELGLLLASDVRDSARIGEVDAPMVDLLARLPAGTSRLNQMLALEQAFFLPDHNLTYTDKMSMAVGVEVRVPFLDLELVDFAARLPDRFKQRARTGKWVLKKAMEPYLPRDVIYRPKTGFGAPLRRWIRGELRPLLTDVLSRESLTRRGLFDPGAVHQLIARNQDGHVDAAYTLFSLMAIEIWCRRFIDAGGDPAL